MTNLFGICALRISYLAGESYGHQETCRIHIKLYHHKDPRGFWEFYSFISESNLEGSANLDLPTLSLEPKLPVCVLEKEGADHTILGSASCQKCGLHHVITASQISTNLR